MKPLLLANENFPAPSVKLLRQAGYDVHFVAEQGADLSDAQVLSIAASQQRWILTFDRDYGELVFARNGPRPPCAVLFRLPHYGLEEPAQRLLDLLTKPETLLGQFVVIEQDSLRKRPLLKVM